MVNKKLFAPTSSIPKPPEPVPILILQFFTVVFNLVDHSRYLGWVLNVASNTNATFNWTNLKSSTTYEWYVEIVDSSGVKNTSTTWNFTTGSD